MSHKTEGRLAKHIDRAAGEVRQHPAYPGNRPFRDLSLRYRGNASYDVEVGPVVIELASEPKGWTFWGVRIGEERFGGRSIVPPGAFHDWLDATAPGTEES